MQVYGLVGQTEESIWPEAQIYGLDDVILNTEERMQMRYTNFVIYWIKLTML